MNQFFFFWKELIILCGHNLIREIIKVDLYIRLKGEGGSVKIWWTQGGKIVNTAMVKTPVFLLGPYVKLLRSKHCAHTYTIRNEKSLNFTRFSNLLLVCYHTLQILLLGVYKLFQ